MNSTERRLKKRIKELEEELQKVKLDRDSFRNDFVYLLKESIRILGADKHWNMAWLVEDLAKKINKKEKWYW